MSHVRPMGIFESTDSQSPLHAQDVRSAWSPLVQSWLIKDPGFVTSQRPSQNTAVRTPANKGQMPSSVSIFVPYLDRNSIRTMRNIELCPEGPSLGHVLLCWLFVLRKRGSMRSKLLPRATRNQLSRHLGLCHHQRLSPKAFRTA